MTLVPVETDGTSLIDGYRAVTGDGPIRVLEALARRLRGHRIVMVNSTSTGGGVAEILHRLVRLLLELGVPTTWEVMPGEQRFYGVTKSIHNALHGEPVKFGAEETEIYEETNRKSAAEVALDGDLILIHDPQPAPFARLRRQPGQRWMWRCHIDLSRADPTVWNVVAGQLDWYDAAVFSHVSFVPRLVIPAYLAPPSIDPLSDKNRELSEEEEDALLAPYDLPRTRPVITQISRFDRLKDPLGVLEAFKLLRRQEDAHLVLAGGTADDDPEGAEVLAEVQEAAKGRDDVSILALPNAHTLVNAFQRRSTVVVQKSLREGFALTVSEALWKRRAVVASAVGGIPLQVLHERTGMLVRSIEGCAYQMRRLLRTAALRRRLGQNGREHVRDNFLHPREARDYLALFVRMLEHPHI